MAFDAASNSSGTGTTASWSHTITGTQRVLFAAFAVTSGQLVSATFNGAAMTLVQNTFWGSGNLYLYYIFTPPTGTYTISAELNTSAVWLGAAASYTSMAGPDPEQEATGTASGTSLTTNITTITDNAWVIGLGFSDTDPLSPGSGTTQRNATNNLAIFDSGAAITPAGATSLAIGASGTSALRMTIVSVKPASGAPTTTTSSTTSTSTSTSSSTSSSSSTSTSSTTTAEPPPDVDQTGVPWVYVRQ